jgi:predicted DsbA family dithiol-disulfide isomerase
MSSGEVGVVVDFLCPYSYLTFEAVRRVSAENGIAFAWLGYELRPDLPVTGVPAVSEKTDLARRAKRWEDIHARAREFELVMHPLELLTNTRVALETVTFDMSPEAREAFQQRTFAAYFGEQQNIGNSEVVFELARESNIDVDALRVALASGVLRARLDATIATARSRGLDNVPAVLVGERSHPGVHTASQVRALLA